MARCAMMITAATLFLASAQAVAQPGTPASAPPPTTVQTSPPRLDDLLAPIALYPDPLLSQILMAASYPVEVVQADRWLADPGNAALHDGDLAAVVNQQAWDPSVKSLVPFPRVLEMMDSHLDWTENLGEAFVANPAAVMDAVQDLRRRALQAGAIRSDSYLTVTDADGIITILPAAPQEVYYPAYNPAVAYGPWPYPDFPPYAFDDTDDGCSVGDFGYCWFGVAVVLPLWGWDRWDWRGHQLRLDPERFAALNEQRRPSGGSTWVHELGHRHGVPYQDAETRARYPAADEALQRAARGFPEGEAAAFDRAQGLDRATPRAAESRFPPSFESYGRGEDVRMEAQRGLSSRLGAPGGGFRGAPTGGGRRR
jgi:hypothetical protein